MKKKNTKEQIQVKSTIIKDVNEDTNQIMKLILILIGVALISVLLYFLTAKFLVKDKFQNDENAETEVTINYDSINVGNVFNRPYDEYYVLAYDSTDSQAVFYESLVSNYQMMGNYKLYFLDLSLEINKAYVNEVSNKKATKPSELSLTDPTLILIKKGKIVEYLDDKDSINEALK